MHVRPPRTFNPSSGTHLTTGVTISRPPFEIREPPFMEAKSQKNRKKKENHRAGAAHRLPQLKVPQRPPNSRDVRARY